MANYEANADLAVRLIRDAGRSLPMSRQTAGAYDPESGLTVGAATTAWNVQGIVLPATFRSMVGLDNGMLESGALTLSKARKILAAAKGALLEPLPEDLIMFDGQTWRVLACVPLKPADVAIVYKIGVMLA